MNYYIQGNAANADKIKAAFEKLGLNVCGHRFMDESTLYYTHPDYGYVLYVKCGNGFDSIIKTHPDYKELKLAVEPKFKVGDWIVRGEGFVYEPSLITEIRDYYICELLNGERVTYTLNDVHKNFHLWTIADAKDGDVLATDNGWTCIFQAFDGCVFSSYCFMDSQKWFCEFGSEAHTPDSRINGNIHPATKEQRDLLFRKMKEAEYQWDADKKELRKIQTHYDIKNFHVGMPVLVRDYFDEEWKYVQFSHMRKLTHALVFDAGCSDWYQCIPFNDDTKHLLGTTDMCPEEYINW